MPVDTHIILIVNTTILLIVIILALIYLSLILLVQRFHTINNILTGNFCLAGIVCCLFWAIYDVLSGFYPTILFNSITACILIQYLSVTVNGLVVYSISMITLNRFLTIIYPNKGLFKRRAWALILSAVQWMIAIILPLPYIVVSVQVNIS
jgi:hypothetical protein